VVVIILEKVPASVRGELTRWMLELRTGVFVGDVSAMVRELLWKTICSKVRGGAILVHSAANEQGFAMRFFGDTSRQVEDFDGLKLIRVFQKRDSTVEVVKAESN
jgi:CRISPR-associated protein Cas2